MIIIFEKYKNKPKIGGYVIVKDYDESEIEVTKFLDTTIGEIIEIADKKDAYGLPYKIEYEIPEDIYNLIRYNMMYQTAKGYKKGEFFLLIDIGDDEISRYFHSKYDRDFYLQTRKYNI